MFDSVSVLGRSRQRLGPSAAFSIGLHVLVLGIAVSLTRMQPVTAPAKPVTVVVQPLRFAKSAAPEGATRAPDVPKRRQKPRPRPVQAEVLRAPEPEPPPMPSAPEKTSEEPAQPEGIPAGLGDSAGGGPGIVGGDAPVTYDDATMIPPRRLSGPDPEYLAAARAYEVQGVMVVKCVVTIQGVVRDCRVVEGLPYMNEAVVRALVQRRYEPARLANGVPIAVDYTFYIRFQLNR